MTHDPATRFRHAGDGFATLFRHAPRFESSLSGESWLASAGEAHCMWNWIGVTNASPANIAELRGVVERCRERGIKGLACFHPDASAGLADTVRELGLNESGVVPLMICDPADAAPIGSSALSVECVIDPATFAAGVSLMAASFDVSVE